MTLSQFDTVIRVESAWASLIEHAESWLSPAIEVHRSKAPKTKAAHTVRFAPTKGAEILRKIRDLGHRMPRLVDPEQHEDIVILRCTPGLSSAGIINSDGQDSALIVESCRFSGAVKLTLDPSDERSDQHVCDLLKGMLAAELQRRGYLFLHATAIRQNGNVIAFCGDTSAGKSSLAHMLGSFCGADHVGDDLLVLAPAGHGQKADVRGWPSSVAVGATLLQACGQAMAVDPRNLRLPQPQPPGVTADSKGWTKDKRFRLHFEPEEYSRYFRISRSAGGLLGMTILADANLGFRGFKLSPIARPLSQFRDIMEPARHLKHVTDFLSLGRSAKAERRCRALRRFAETPAYKLTFGPDIKDHLSALQDEFQDRMTGVATSLRPQ